MNDNTTKEFPIIETDRLRLRELTVDDKAIRWGIELKSEKNLMGTCGFHNWNKTHARAEIGYELNKEYWRKGYVIEAVEAIIRYGFEEFNLYRIELIERII